MSEKPPRVVVVSIGLIASLALGGCGLASEPTPSLRVNDVENSDNTFTLIQEDDTQYGIAYHPEDDRRTIKWDADNARRQKFVYLAQVGDFTNQSSRRSPVLRDQEWMAGSNIMQQLDGVLLFGIDIGNHDIDAWSKSTDGEAEIKKDRSANNYNKYFPVSRYQNQPGFGDSYPAGKSDNLYQKFSAGGTNWGVLTLKYEPTSDEIAWANKVVDANPQRRFIINTHSYLYANNTLSTGGHIVWDGLAKKHKNISLILSGHTGPTAHIDQVGVNGNKVAVSMMDYQSLDKPGEVHKPDLNTYQRFLTFSPNERMISVKTYSPLLNKHMTDSANQFTFTDIDFGAVS